MTVDIGEIREAAIKEVLALLRDPETYAVRAGEDLTGPWMEDGCRLAALVEQRLLTNPVELSPEARGQYVRHAAIAANVTTVAFPPPYDDGSMNAMFWNATTDHILFEGQVEDEDARMPDGQRVRARASFTIGFGIIDEVSESERH